MIRLPTAQELEEGYARQCAEDAYRAAHPRPPEPRDQDDTPREADDIPAYCDVCGRLFKYATAGMAVMQLARHRRQAHPETVEQISES